MPRNTKGSVMAKREVACRECGATLLRATHFATSRCVKCKAASHNQNHNKYIARCRIEARRYRILMHVLGWPDAEFDEALRELRASPLAFRDEAETRAARYDLALERRARRRSARAKGAA